MVGGFKFQNIDTRASLALQRSIFLICVSAKEFFKGSFYQEGFTNRGYKKWEKRKRSYGHKILTKSGALRDSIKSVTSKATLSTTIISNLEYSAIHNEGGTGKLPQGGTFNMPERQFIGDSEQLNKGVEMIIENEIDKLFI
jgi:phage gpG-like protein